VTSINRVRAIWSGFPGGPGVSTFYSLVPDTTVVDVRALFLAIHTGLPSSVSVQVENSGDILEDTTGEVTGLWSTDAVLPVDGDNTAAYSAPSGICVNWITATVLDGHRVKGRTFFVPAGGNFYEDNGTLSAGALAIFEPAASTFVAAEVGALVVWHRPRVARAADGSRPAVTARAGGHALVTASSVPDKAVVLRSRRD